MPSAAAKKKRADQRARVHVPKDASSLRSGQQLDDDIAAFNYKQQRLNAEREDLMKRMTQQNVSSSMETANKHILAAETSERNVQHSQAAGPSEPQVQHKCQNSMAQSRPTGAQFNTADRPSQSGVTHTESCGRQASPAAMVLLQSTYPQRLKLASAKAVEELLDLLHMYEPPNDPEGRKQFESQVYATVKRILRNQNQRAYRKAKKMGML